MTPLTLGIRAVVAQHERELISKRTKDALAAAKKRGRQLGGRRYNSKGKVVAGSAKARASATRVRQERSAQRAADLAPTIKAAQAVGATSLRDIADALNAQGIPTARGTGQWTATQVQRVLSRLQ